MLNLYAEFLRQSRLKRTFSFHFMFLLVELDNILTSQKRHVIDLKFLSMDNTTRNSSKLHGPISIVVSYAVNKVTS